MLFIDVVLMYLAVFPIMLSVRNTALVQKDADDRSDADAHRNIVAKIWHWLRSRKNKLLADVFWLFFIMVIILIIEDNSIQNDGINFQIFNFVFEIASGYGTVGLSIGYPGSSLCFSTFWSDGSKILLIFVLVIGRHRGLPSALDTAVQIVRVDTETLPDSNAGRALAERRVRRKLVPIVPHPDSLAPDVFISMVQSGSVANLSALAGRPPSPPVFAAQIDYEMDEMGRRSVDSAPPVLKTPFTAGELRPVGMRRSASRPSLSYSRSAVGLEREHDDGDELGYSYPHTSGDIVVTVDRPAGDAVSPSNLHPALAHIYSLLDETDLGGSPGDVVPVVFRRGE